jgi:DNA-binding NarL/FixJ family response regulator
MHNSTHRSPAQVADAVKKAKPDVLITWVSLPSLYDDLRVLDNIKYAAPNVLITVLGAVSNVMPEEILKRERVDIAVRGNYPRYNLILNLVQTLRARRIITWQNLIYIKPYIGSWKLTSNNHCC